MDNSELLREQITDPAGLSPAGPETDEFRLPFESLDEYSDAPLEFEELASTLWERLNDTYAQAVRYNRHSPHYQELCDHLEKNIRLLGSMCVTKAVLEQKGLIFPALEGLSVSALFSMVSLHFRKCDRAFLDIRDGGDGLDMGLLDRLCRWGILSERLKATEEKIRKIQSGKISADSLLERAEVFRREPRAKGPERERQAIRKVSSLPVLGSLARDILREKKRSDAEKRREERKQQRELEALMRESAKPLMQLKSDLISSNANLLSRDPHELFVNGKSFAEWEAMEQPMPPDEEPSWEKHRKLREQRRKKKKK